MTNRSNQKQSFELFKQLSESDPLSAFTVYDGIKAELELVAKLNIPVNISKIKHPLWKEQKE